MLTIVNIPRASVPANRTYLYERQKVKTCCETSTSRAAKSTCGPRWGAAGSSWLDPLSDSADDGLPQGALDLRAYRLLPQ